MQTTQFEANEAHTYRSARRLIEQSDPVELIAILVGVWLRFERPIKLEKALFEHDRLERIVEQFNVRVDREPNV